MKNVLIIYPHFPPSNLAGVHRARLFAQHLPGLGWNPIILTVHERYYEEPLDYNLVKLLPSKLRIVKADAYNVTKPRLIGDIGLRAFFQLYKKARSIILSESITFLYIPVPSFYCALLGRWLHESTKVKYGIDYIDPWVHIFPGSKRLLSRHWWSTRIARFLEPIAVKKASLITGVAEGYYEGVVARNPHLVKRAILGAMPYGGEKADHDKINELNLKPYLFEEKSEKIRLVYAGAFLPYASDVLEEVFKVMRHESSLFENAEFHFIGTGRIKDNTSNYTIKPLAKKYGLWEKSVFEHPCRIPYLDVLVHLKVADAVFIVGSTEPHYTPSKVYQGILAGKPILAVLHNNSSAANVIESANAGKVLTFNGSKDIRVIYQNFASYWKDFTDYAMKFKPGEVNAGAFEKYSANAVTHQLVELITRALL